MGENQKKRMSQEDKEALENILKVEREPEHITRPIIENKHNDITQFKVAIPKKYAKAVNLNSKDFAVEFTLHKEKQGDKIISKITAEIIKKNASIHTK